MKICHMTSAHNSTDIRILDKECASLAKIEGYEVSLVARGESYVKNNVAVHGTGEVKGGRLNRMFGHSKTVYKKALELDADVYHFHDPELIPYAKKLKKRGKKVVFDAHEDYYEDLLIKEYIPKFFRKIIAETYRIYSNKAIRSFDAVISVTPMQNDKLLLENKNTVMITNYPIISEADSPVDDSPEMIPGKMVYAGVVSAFWSHDIIIKCLEDVDVSPMKYNIWGRADEAFLKELSSLKAWDKVEYHGIVAHAEVLKNLREANMSFALINRDFFPDVWKKEGTLGNTKLFESMAAGIPVIATDFELWKDIVEGSNCGICVDPFDSKQIVEAITRILSDIDYAKELGKNGLKAAREKYNWGTQEKILFELYKQFE